MQTFFVRRRGIAVSASGLDAALTRLRSFEDVAPAPRTVRWLHSYALREAAGGFGLACLFHAESAAALHEHARIVRLAVDEIVRVAATLVERPFAPTLAHLVRRRGAWATAAALDRSVAAARHAAQQRQPREVGWQRSYVVEEGDGHLGTWCLYQAASAAALVAHAASAGMPADEVTPVLGRVVFHDPDAARREDRNHRVSLN